MKCQNNILSLCSLSDKYNYHSDLLHWFIHPIACLKEKEKTVVSSLLEAVTDKEQVLTSVSNIFTGA